MDKDQKEFWKNYKKELINPIDVLISNGHYSAASKLILSGIDSLAGFYSGRITFGQVSSSFIQFVEQYMSKFNDLTFSTSGNVLKNRKTGHTIIKPTEILFYIFRNDMIHDGSLGIGVEIYKDDNYKVLWSGSGFQIFRINIVGFFEYFKKAIIDYENDLNHDESLKSNFADKYNDIKNFSFGD